jgi:hypothetical protein
MARKSSTPKAVRNEEYPDTWDGLCPRCPFVSARHDTAKAARSRITEHLEEPHDEEPTTDTTATAEVTEDEEDAA